MKTFKELLAELPTMRLKSAGERAKDKKARIKRDRANPGAKRQRERKRKKMMKKSSTIALKKRMDSQNRTLSGDKKRKITGARPTRR